MIEGFIQVGALRRAIEVYLRIAYPLGVPESVQAKISVLTPLAEDATAPVTLFEVSACMGHPVYALRLGQPRYPHMKLMVESAPSGGGYLFRADAHDACLHAADGSPDAAPLAALRAGNKELTEAIEAAWTAGGLPTFRAYLRAELGRRKQRE